jgi:hypothetical protein
MKLTKIYEEVLRESIQTKIIAYHGTDHNIDRFSDSFLVGDKNIQHHGAGIYFATSYENARMFGNNVYKVELSGNFISEDNPTSDADPDKLINLMKLSDEDEWELEAQNYHPDPETGLMVALEDALDQPNEADAFMRIQNGWYMYDGLGYVRGMTKVGIDGVIVNPPSDWVDEKHIIIFNPNAIKFIEKVNVKEDLTYRHTNTSGAGDDEYEVGMVKENNNIKELLKYSAYDDSEMSEMYLKKLIDTLRKLPSNLTLYRVVFLEKKSDLRDKELGSHYVLNKKDLDNSHYVEAHSNAKGEPFILTVKVSKNEIDEFATLKHNMQYPHEKEITLKNTGSGAKLIDIKPFKNTSYGFSAEFNDDDFYNDLGYDEFS